MNRRTKLILIYLSLTLMFLSPVKAEEDEEEETELPIDTGCVKDKPALCSDGICRASYDECDIVEGCTSNLTPLMCPSGLCVRSFEECSEKSYDCVVTGHKRCADGYCRADCSGIRTNGCTMDEPFYCPTGKCVKYEIQCTDFRCPYFEEPYMCDNLICKKNTMSCVDNQTSLLIKADSSQVLINENDQIKNVHTIWYNHDENNMAFKFYYTGHSLFYNKFSAGYHKYKELAVEEYTGSLNFEPVPFSDYEDSTILYDKIDLDVELLTSNIFAKEFSSLQPYEFVRSSVFKYNIENFEYNHLPYKSPPNVQIRFTRLNGYPKIEDSSENGDNEDLKDKEERESKLLEEIYCLGYYDIKQKKWFCISRKIVNSSGQLLEYKLPMAGIYGIIYYPRTTDEDTGPCSFICQNKKALLSMILLVLPVTLLTILYIKDYLKRLYKLTKNNLISLAAKDDDPFYNNQENNETKEITPDKLLDEDNYEIKGDTYTFVNPLIFGVNNKSSAVSEKELEGQKVKLKFKNTQALNEKLLLLKKLSALNSEIADLKDDIARLKKLQGINAIYENAGNQDENK